MKAITAKYDPMTAGTRIGFMDNTARYTESVVLTNIDFGPDLSTPMKQLISQLEQSPKHTIVDPDQPTLALYNEAVAPFRSNL